MSESQPKLLGEAYVDSVLASVTDGEVWRKHDQAYIANVAKDLVGVAYEWVLNHNPDGLLRFTPKGDDVPQGEIEDYWDGEIKTMKDGVRVLVAASEERFRRKIDG